MRAAADPPEPAPEQRVPRVRLSLAARTLVWVLLSSALFSTLITFWAVRREQQRETEEARAESRAAVSSSLAPLSGALWAYDQATTRAILDGLLTVSTLQELHLRAPEMDVRVARAQPHPVDERWQLELFAPDASRVIGVLEVGEAHALLGNELDEHLWLLGVTQLLGMAGLTLMHFVIFNWQISRHLRRLATQLRQLSGDSSNTRDSAAEHTHAGAHVELKRRLRRYPDELDVVVNAINGFSAARQQAERALRQLNQQLELRIAARTADLRTSNAELARARDAADAANVAKSAFLANVSHEIRTPLNAIIGLSSLAERTPLNAQQRGYVEKTRGAAETLLGLINDLLDSAKIEAGKLELAPQPFLLDDLISQVSGLIAFRAQQKGLAFLLDIDPQAPPLLVGDALRLNQILLNLCNNAIKFTARGEVKLTVRCEREDGRTAAGPETGIDVRPDAGPDVYPGTASETVSASVSASDSSTTAGTRPDAGAAPDPASVRLRFAVRDTGIGLSDAQQARLFQAFSQADASTTREYGGTGLGLSICRQLVELMGGRIGVLSQPGAGSEFWFSIELPLGQGSAGHIATSQIPTQHIPTQYSSVEHATAEHSTAEHVRAHTLPAAPEPSLSPAPPLRWRILEGCRVLLVEDNPLNQQLASEILQLDAGIRVRVAGNGREALACLSQNPQAFDAVLMDVQMPEMDGYAATRAIRQLPGLQALPIIAMTAHAMAEDVARCKAAGMNDFVSKPFLPDQLFSTLSRWITPAGNGNSGIDHTGTGQPGNARAEHHQTANASAITPASGGATPTAGNANSADPTRNNPDRQPAATGGNLQTGLFANRLSETTRSESRPSDNGAPEQDAPEHRRQETIDAEKRDRENRAPENRALINQAQESAALKNSLTENRALENSSPTTNAPEPFAPATHVPEERVTAASTVANSATATAQHTSTIHPTLPRLDTVAGQRYCRGNAALYRKVLQLFLDTREASADEIRRALASGDLTTASRVAHTVKSVAGTLGARRLSHIAGELETRLGTPAPGDAEPLLQQFAEEMSGLCAALREYLESGENGE